MTLSREDRLARRRRNRMAGDDIDKASDSAASSLGATSSAPELEGQIMDRREIQSKMDSGMSAQDIYDFTKDEGINYNKKGRSFMQEQGDFAIGKGADQWGDILGNTGTDKTPEKQEEAEVFKDEKVKQVINNVMNSEGPAARAEETLLTGSGDGMNMSFDRTFGDNQNIMGDNNTISGDFNQGNQDYSTNIGTQGGGSSLAMRKKMLGL